MLTVNALRAWGANVDEALVRCLNNENFYVMLVGKAIKDPQFEKLKESCEAGDLEQGFEAGDKERPVDDHHRQGEQHLCQRKAEMIVHQKSRQRPVQHVVAHRDIHQKDQKSDGQLEPAHQLRRLRVLERFLLSRQSG